MSTWLYLQCQDHNPPLEAEDESGQHLYDIPRIKEEIANRAEVVDRWMNHGPVGGSAPANMYFEQHSAKFLRAHFGCNIRIIDEYGRYHD